MTVAPVANPLSIVESHFDEELTRASLKRFDEVSDDEWVRFAKRYLRVMQDHFVDEFLTPAEGSRAPVRLYFEPRLSGEWGAAVTKRHDPTPLLGLNPDPGPSGDLARRDVSRMLSPLTKHLLIADSVYIRDSFYYCFDYVADSVSEADWRARPGSVEIVKHSIRQLKNWLPVLAELRDLIETRALVFMPYYVTPSFPFDASSPALDAFRGRVRIRPDETLCDVSNPPSVDLDADWDVPPPAPEGLAPRENVNTGKVLGAWMNSRILGLDPVFPNRASFEWASRLFWEEDSETIDMTSDLISLDILPFGRAEGIDIDELLSLRSNEAVFEEVRHVVGRCKEHLRIKEYTSESRREHTMAGARVFLQDELAHYERRSVVRIAADNPAAGIAVSLAFGSALMTLPPLAGLLAGAGLAPGVVRWLQRRTDPKRRAISQLQALL